MKRTLLLIALILLAMPALAQIVNIPDPNFKDALVNDLVWDTDGDFIPDSVVDTNGDGEIQVTEAESVFYLYIDSYDIASLEGIDSFFNIRELYASNNLLTAPDLTGLINLEILLANQNTINSITFDSSNNVEVIELVENSLTEWDHPELTALIDLDLSINPLFSLNTLGLITLERLFFNETDLTDLMVENLPNLEHIRGRDGEALSTVNLVNLPSLKYVDFVNQNLTDIDVSAAPNIEGLYLSDNSISSLDVSFLSALTHLLVDRNELTNLDLAGLGNLKVLYISYNEGIVVDFTGLSNLESLFASDSGISDLDFSNFPILSLLVLNRNPLPAVVDITELTELESLFVNETPVEFILAKNGNNPYLGFRYCPNLSYICVDEDNLENALERVELLGYTDVVVNTYCSLNPGGDFSTVEGQTRYDVSLDGCDDTDMLFAGLRFNIDDGVESGTFVPDESGFYSIPLEDGSYDITAVMENPEYFAIDPSGISVNFPDDPSPVMQNYCLTPAGVFNDLEVVLLPTAIARPGFEAGYTLLYKNKGTVTLSGQVVLNFEETVLDFVNSDVATTSISEGEIVWDFNDLEPFGEREIEVVFLLNTPTDAPPLDSGDILDFTASLTFDGVDETPENNTFDLNQEVVNSFDPNDKTALEGDKILEESVGEYMHYLIRFENLGTANATNVVVADTIDTSKYQLSTLIPLSGSHDFVTRVNNNVAEFIFEDINLPFDDANNDGYVLFKIKTQESLVLGDSFSNSAAIYFDFNAPIITNDAVTTVVKPLSVNEFRGDLLRIYPNPAQEILNIAGLESSELKSLQVYNLQGQLLIDNQLENNTIDVSGLSSGVYFIKINTSKGSVFKRFLKK